MAFKRFIYPFIAFSLLGAFACKGAILWNLICVPGKCHRAIIEGLQPFLLKARRLGSNFLQLKGERVCMSQLPILEPKVSCSEIHPNKVTQFSSFFFILPSLPLNGPSFQSFTGFCDTRISSSSFIMASFFANILVPCRGVSSSSSKLYLFTWEVRTTKQSCKGARQWNIQRH